MTRSVLKIAFWGAVAKGAFGGVKQVGKFGLGTMGLGSGAAATAGKVYGAVAPGLPTSKPGDPNGGASLTTPLGSLGAKQAGLHGVKTGDEHPPGWKRALNAASYAAFAAPYLSEKIHANKKLTTALNAAGLLGLGTTTGHSLAHGDNLAGYDLAGLGLMGAGMLHEHLLPKPGQPSGH